MAERKKEKQPRKTRKRVFKRLRKKGITLEIPILEREAWAQLIQRDPEVPRSYGELKRLSGRLFSRELRAALDVRRWEVQPSRGLLIPGVEECGESSYAQFFAGLANPWLTAAQVDDLDSDLDADTPTFENSHETDHFILRWTSTSDHAPDNIADSAIVIETGDYLEEAWDRYVADFGRAPYVPAGATKIEVLFQDISGFGVASPPDGPIKFDAANWISQPGIRRPTSAHELFHKLQYAFGYRTVWAPVSPYKWFSEGTASWSEVEVWGRVSGAYKILDLFSDPDRNLYDASYRALPFWIFYQARQKSGPADHPMRSFLEKYELSGNEELALEQGVADEWAPNNVYRNLAHFFALFSRDRRIGHWKIGPTGSVYGDILDPLDNPIAPALAVVDVPLGSGDAYGISQTVSKLGSDYYRFALAPDADGRDLVVSVDGAATGDFSYYLIWEKGSGWVRAVFPPGVTEDYSLSETITLSDADALVLVVSGRGTGGTYTLSASVS